MNTGNMQKSHFVFDLDDTLMNSYGFNQQMFYETFLPHAPDIDEVFVRDLHFRSRGTSMHVQFDEVIKHFNLDLDPEQLAKENEILHQKHFREITFFDHVEELLRGLKARGNIISLCTNRQYGSLNPLLDDSGLRKYFDNVVSCLDEGHEKPDPVCLLSIIDKYDIPKSEYIYFGDSKVDCAFATNAGIDFIIIDQYINQKKYFKVIVESFLGKPNNKRVSRGFPRVAVKAH